MARWLSFFAEYNFTIEYKPGRLNVLADALSRRPDYEVNHFTSLSSNVYGLIRDAYDSDAQCALLLKALSDDTTTASLPPRIRARLHRYTLSDGLLHYRVRPDDEPRVVVPADEDLRYVIAHGFHDAPGAGHLGREKTYSLVSTKFWWPKMYKWVGRYVHTCDVCQREMPSPHSQAPLQSLSVPNDCWRSVSMDFFFGLPKTEDGHNGVLVFVDRLSKMVHLAPVSDTHTGLDCAKLFVDVVFRLHGLPDSIVSDRDPRFTGDFWNGLFQILGIKLDMSTTDHPETDGQTKRVNRVVEDILRSYCAEHPRGWNTTLPMVEFAVNNAVHASTGLTPFYVNGLRHPALPLCLMGETKSGEGGARQVLASQLEVIPKPAIRRHLEEFLSTRVNVITRVRDAMATAHDRQKEQADRHGRQNTSMFKEGDFVLVSTKNLSQDAVSSLGSSKLLPRYIGPFRVLKRIGTAYRLDLPSWLQTHPTFYVGLLKPYHGGGDGASQLPVGDPTSTEGPPPSDRSDTSSVGQQLTKSPGRDGDAVSATLPVGTRRSTRLAEATSSGDAVPATVPPISRSSSRLQRPVRAPPPVLDRSGVPHYHVEDIMGARRRAGQLELCVKWLGYPSEENTWLPHAQLTVDFPDWVRAFALKNPQWFQ